MRKESRHEGKFWCNLINGQIKTRYQFPLSDVTISIISREFHHVLQVAIQ